MSFYAGGIKSAFTLSPILLLCLHITSYFPSVPYFTASSLLPFLYCAWNVLKLFCFFCLFCCFLISYLIFLAHLCSFTSSFIPSPLAYYSLYICFLPNFFFAFLFSHLIFFICTFPLYLHPLFCSFSCFFVCSFFIRHWLSSLFVDRHPSSIHIYPPAYNSSSSPHYPLTTLSPPSSVYLCCLFRLHCSLIPSFLPPVLSPHTSQIPPCASKWALKS